MLDHAEDDLSLSTMQTLLLESDDIQGFHQDFTDLRTSARDRPARAAVRADR